MIRPPLVAVALAAFLVLSGIPAPAAAQGTSGLLPPQISVGSALTIAERLRLSVEQRQAWLQLHDAYALRCEALYDSDVQWLIEHQGLMSLRGADDQGHTARDFFDRRAVILAAMARLDAELFDALTPMLTEEQARGLLRARRARERRRWTAGALLWFVQSTAVDLVAHPILPELDEETSARIEPALVAYEDAARRLMQSVHDEAIDMYAGIDDAMARLGLDADDPADAEKIMQAAQELATTMGDSAFRRGVQLGRLQRRTLENIIAVLPPDEGWATLRRYTDRRFRELRGQLPTLPERLGRLCRDDTLDPDQRAAVCEIHAAYLAQVRAAARALLDEHEAFEALASPFAQTGADYSAHEKRAAVHRARLDTATNEAIRAITAIAAIDPNVLQRTTGAVAAEVPAAARAPAAERIASILAGADESDLAPSRRAALVELRLLCTTRTDALHARLDATPESSHDARQWLQFQLTEVQARTHAWIDAITGP